MLIICRPVSGKNAEMARDLARKILFKFITRFRKEKSRESCPIGKMKDDRRNFMYPVYQSQCFTDKIHCLKKYLIGQERRSI